jgi:hypothetical protein
MVASDVPPLTGTASVRIRLLEVVLFALLEPVMAGVAKTLSPKLSITPSIRNLRADGDVLYVLTTCIA